MLFGPVCEMHICCDILMCVMIVKPPLKSMVVVEPLASLRHPGSLLREDHWDETTLHLPPVPKLAGPLRLIRPCRVYSLGDWHQ